MSSRLLVVMVGVLLTFVTGVYAQQPSNGNASPATAASTSTSNDPAEEPGAGAFTLQGAAVESARNVSRQSAVLAPYELPGTGIGGGEGSAQTILTAPSPGQGAPIRTESGILFYPSVFFGFGYNDNVLSSKFDKLGSSLINVSPQVMAELKRRGDRYTALFVANHTSYSDSSNDNYTNYETWVAGDNYFTARARMGWTLGQVSASDPRGASLRATSTSPDHWNAPTLRGRFIYGAPEAAGRIEVDADTRHKRYDNNRAITEIADRNENGLAGRFFYRLGSRSLALVEMSNRVFDYPSAAASDDNTDRRLYVGYTWEASAATTGIIKVGRMTKRFDQPGHDQYSGSAWEATVRWLPRTYSAFEFMSAKLAEDPSGLGKYLLNTRNGISWKHQWSKSFTTVASTNLNRTIYAGTSRTDDVLGISVTANYNFRRWLTTGVDFSNTNLQSSDTAAEWKRKVIMFTATFTL